ncbi:MAG: serine/threonine protein kinase [Deltaproteobacteria bacterium]|nr:serine/threonine protein kinase [Deltaproteobacteria bacterium]
MAKTLRRGTRLGKYRLERLIDRGSFAQVWKARDMVEARVVALKVTHSDVVDDWGRKEIEKEARIVSRLDHPNIVAIRNADWIEGRFVIASDLAIANLSKYPRARRSGSVALGIVRDVTAGLAYAHERRLMHRDVKPENILIFADGRAAITDFGASRFAKGVTRAYNTETGTLGYMAPEQAYGRVRFASDVFSLGLIAYEVVTGILPMWPFEWPPERFDLFDVKVPQPLQTVLRKAAQFDPKRRYKDAVELHLALEAAFARTEKPAKRKRRRLQPAVRSPLEVHARQGTRAALRLPPLRGADRGGDEVLSLVWRRRQLVRGDHKIPAGVSRLRKGSAAGVGGVSVVLPRALCFERPNTAEGCPCGADLHDARLRGAAARVHALLPAVQGEAAPRLEARAPARPLPSLPLADLALVPALLPVVRQTRAARGLVRGDAALTAGCV